MSNYRVRQAIKVSQGWTKDEQILLGLLGTFLKDDELITDKATNKILVDECGFPLTSLKRARRGLIKRGAIGYEPGRGRGHPSVYTILCLPATEEKGPSSGPLSEGEGKESAQAAPFRAVKGAERPDKRGRAGAETSENEIQLVPQPELLPAPPGAGSSSAASGAQRHGSSPNGAEPLRARNEDPVAVGDGLATVTELRQREEDMRPRSPGETWRQQRNDIIDRWQQGEITVDQKREAMAALGSMPRDNGLGAGDPFLSEPPTGTYA